MKKIAFLGILTLAFVLGAQFGFAGAAQAQTANNWAGLYIGPSIGVANSHDNGNETCINPSGTVNGGGCPTPAFGNVRANGGLAGGQIGYNLQFDRFVIGPEVQFDASTLTGSMRFGGPIPCISGGSAPGTFNASETAGWLAAARLRLGYAFSQKTLVYLSGGYARMNGSVLSSLVYNGGSPFYTTTQNIQKNGFIGGVGAEWQFQPRASFRFELSEFTFPNYTTDAPESIGGGYFIGKVFDFRGYTLTGGLNIKI